MSYVILKIWCLPHLLFMKYDKVSFATPYSLIRLEMLFRDLRVDGVTFALKNSFFMKCFKIDHILINYS